MNRFKGSVEFPADAQIIADPAALSLVVSGRSEHVKAIEEIVSELRLKTKQPRPRITRIYDLKNAQAATLATTVTQLYTEKLKDQPGANPDQVLVLPDATSNRLIVMAPDDEFDTLEDLIQRVDQIGQQTAGTRIFKLQANDPAQVANNTGVTVDEGASVAFDASNLSMSDPDTGPNDTSWRVLQVPDHGDLTVNGRAPEPFAIAYVELEEGPMVLTNIVDCDSDALTIGMPVRLVFKPSNSGPPVAMFTPA